MGKPSGRKESKEAEQWRGTGTEGEELEMARKRPMASVSCGQRCDGQN